MGTRDFGKQDQSLNDAVFKDKVFVVRELNFTYTQYLKVYIYFKWPQILLEKRLTILGCIISTQHSRRYNKYLLERINE